MRTLQDKVTFINDHSLFRDPVDIEKQKFGTTVKTKVVVVDESPGQTILSTIQRDIIRETAAVIQN